MNLSRVALSLRGKGCGELNKSTLSRFNGPPQWVGTAFMPSHRRQVMRVMARAQTACRATARVARTRRRCCSTLSCVLVRATLAVALRASSRTIFFPLNTSSLDAYGTALMPSGDSSLCIRVTQAASALRGYTAMNRRTTSMRFLPDDGIHWRVTEQRVVDRLRFFQP